MKRKKPLVLFARIREHSNYIEDQDGNQVSIDEARLLWESGQVTDCDYVFNRLATQANWDFAELVRWYDERLPPELDKPIVAVQLRLTPDERDRLRVKAAQVGKQMSAYVRDLVMSDLDATPNGKKAVTQ